MKKLILALTALLIVPALADNFPKGSPKFKDSYRQVMSAAEKSGKPVILVFSAVWCPPCQLMKNEVYPSKEIQAFHDKFEWAYLDVDDRDNQKPAMQYGVGPIPHLQIVDASGKTLDQQIGAMSPRDLSKKLNAALAKAGKSETAAAK